MGYRKFMADYLFDGTQILRNSSVLITDLQGKFENIIPKDEAGQGI